jgi:hypothetical protein
MLQYRYILCRKQFRGLIGSLSNGTVTASFWDKQTSGKTTSAGGTGKTTVEMKSPCTYESAGWGLFRRNSQWYFRLLDYEYLK